MTKLTDIIKGRKSVRTYDRTGIREEDLERIRTYASEIRNPFDIPVRFVFLDAQEKGLSSPVLAGETMYVAGIVPKQPFADVAFGYSFEQLVLYAWSMGIGTVWIAGTMNREIFEQAAGLQNGEMMPCISPLGYPAQKRSLREVMMRRGISADSRKPVEELFFNGTFDTPLASADSEMISDLAELVRWAPSAVNKQPWRIVVQEGKFHFYEKKDKGYVKDNTGDLQKIDVGISLCHMVMGLEELGKHPEVIVKDPSIPVPDGTEYIATVRIGVS